MIKNLVITILAAVCLLVSSAVQAAEVRVVGWKELVPTKLLATNPTAGFSKRQLDAVNMLLYFHENPTAKKIEDPGVLADMDAMRKLLQEKGVKLDDLIAFSKKIRSAVVDELDGQEVRMPGYLLPLELSGTKVTEFLLVPWVGACIHAPPPPPNQIVHVKMAGKEGISDVKQFAAVWVTGVMSVQSSIKSLFLTDGTAGIDVGYSMTGQKVEPYEK